MKTPPFTIPNSVLPGRKGTSLVGRGGAAEPVTRSFLDSLWEPITFRAHLPILCTFRVASAWGGTASRPLGPRLRACPPTSSICQADVFVCSLSEVSVTSPSRLCSLGREGVINDHPSGLSGLVWAPPAQAPPAPSRSCTGTQLSLAGICVWATAIAAPTNHCRSSVNKQRTGEGTCLG